MCKICEWLSELLNPVPPEIEPDPEPIPDPIPEREKYALLVGINKYLQPGSDLMGCVNDILNLKSILINMFGFKMENIIILLNEQATYNNIITELKWLVPHENSELVFANSSHGSYVPDLNGDEVDGYDEILIPYDHDWNRPLTDDILGDIFSLVPNSSFLTFLCDSCHSGTVSRSMETKPRFLKPKINIDITKLIGKKIGDRVFESNHILFSGCKDNQYSSDAYINGIWQGAFTEAYTLYINPTKSWGDIYINVLDHLRLGGFGQTPQLSGSVMDVDGRFIFGGNI